MQPDKRSRLEQLKLRQQRILGTKYTIAERIVPWLPLYDFIVENAIPHTVHYLTATDAAHTTAWQEALQQPPLLHYGFKNSQLFQGDVYPEIEAVANKYPNTHPLRYIPDLPEFTVDASDVALTAKAALQQFENKYQQVFLYYQQYTPLIELPLTAILQYPDVFFDSWHADTIITAADASFLVFYAVDGKWYVG